MYRVFAVIIFSLSFLVFWIVHRFYQFKWAAIVLLILGFVAIKTKSNGIVLLGYAYYSLQLISVLLLPHKNLKFKDVVLGAAFFPRFFSGPIVKNNQIVFSTNIHQDIIIGVVRFVLGLCKVFILSKVLIKNQTNGMEIEYTLVAENEADLKLRKISIESPIGKGLLGKKIGDIAEIQTPGGIMNFEIISISR